MSYHPHDQESVAWNPDSGFFQDHLARYMYMQERVAGASVLDCATGKGYGSYLMAKRAESVLGIDLNPSSIETARQSFARPNLEYRVGDALKLYEIGKRFDVITAFEIIEHIPPSTTDDFLAGIKSILNGRLFISTPNHDVVTKSKVELPEFHINNLKPVELRNALSRHFRKVTMIGQFRRRSPLNHLLFTADVFNLRHLLKHAPLACPPNGEERQVGAEYFDEKLPPLDYIFSHRHWRQAGLTFAICEL